MASEVSLPIFLLRLSSRSWSSVGGEADWPAVVLVPPVLDDEEVMLVPGAMFEPREAEVR